MVFGWSRLLLLAVALPAVLCSRPGPPKPEPPSHQPPGLHSRFDNSTIKVLVKNGFKGQILQPGDPAFANATRPWGEQNEKDPQLALQPISAQDVSTAILWLNQFNLDFAVRSGGAAASQSNQVILNLANLHKIDYVASQNVVHLGPGQTWGDVYPAMASLGVTVLGGRVGFVGVGGFTLGGGISYLQNFHGLASDSIVDAQVVLADGSIKWASTDSNLMYAVRGAGFTIGVVTELVVRAYPKPTTIFSGFLIFPAAQFSTIRDNIANLTATNTNPNISVLVGVVRAPPDNTPVVLVFPIIYGTATFAKQVLSWAYALGPIEDTTGMVTWEQLQLLQNAFVDRPLPTSNYQQHSVVVTQLTSAVQQAAVDWQTALQAQSPPRFFGISILFEPFIPGAFSSHFTSGPWPHSSHTMHVIQIFIEQLNAQPGDADVNAQQLRAGAALIEKAAGPGAVLQRYPNYALAGTPAIEFYGQNLATLQRVKKQFDPKDRFNTSIIIA